MGLFIVKTIIDRHGGQMSLRARRVRVQYSTSRYQPNINTVYNYKYVEKSLVIEQDSFWKCNSAKAEGIEL